MTPSGISLRHDTRDLDALRALLVSLLNDGQHDEAVSLVIKLLADMRDHSDALQVRLQTALRQLYGRRSEKTSPEQLALFEKVLGDAILATGVGVESADETTPEATAGDAKDPSSKPSGKPNGTPHGRSEKPKSLPEDVTPIRLGDEHRHCSQCRRPMVSMPSGETWQVEYIPSQFRVQTFLTEWLGPARMAQSRGRRGREGRTARARGSAGGWGVGRGGLAPGIGEYAGRLRPTTMLDSHRAARHGLRERKRRGPRTMGNRLRSSDNQRRSTGSDRRSTSKAMTTTQATRATTQSDEVAHLRPAFAAVPCVFSKPIAPSQAFSKRNQQVVHCGSTSGGFLGDTILKRQ